ncbi:hypothetical protein VVR12_03200 [Rothia sp. LK2588]|uniref:hypothetical protein n=1 Tax=Rothia sp. LK2588 TaxID=3114369 RepID=UPI0034CDA1C2
MSNVAELNPPPLPQPYEADRLYTLDEAAHRFGLSTAKWIRDQIKAGRLEYIDLNPNGQREKLRVSATALNRLAQSLTHNPGATP